MVCQLSFLCLDSLIHSFAGQLESTMTLSHLKAGQLKQWLGRQDCPVFLQECKVIFDKAFGKSSVNDCPAASAFGPVPEGLKHIICGTKIALHARHSVGDIVYSHCSTHIGNSLVAFYPGGNRSSPPVPGSIQHITVYPNQDVVYLVKCQMPASPGLVDPYVDYLHFPACLYTNALSPDLDLVRPDWILSHYARWAINNDHVVVLILSRVSQCSSSLDIF